MSYRNVTYKLYPKKYYKLLGYNFRNDKLAQSLWYIMHILVGGMHSYTLETYLGNVIWIFV